MTGPPTTRRWIKPVVTLDEAALENAMAALWARVETHVGTRGAAPDGIVGIATGGLRCARALGGPVTLPVFSCARQRPGTGVKRRPALRRALRALPYGLSDWLRRIEDGLLAARTLPALPAASAQLREDAALIGREAAARGLRHLVVIDDAVDSGATLGCVTAALRATLPPGTAITTAVLTRTRPTAICLPDVQLYRETLCRFPWSFDFRGA